MALAGTAKRYSIWAEHIRNGVQPDILVNEIVRVNPELKAVPINVKRVQVLEKEPEPLSKEALHSASLSDDVSAAPGEADNFIRRG